MSGEGKTATDTIPFTYNPDKCWEDPITGFLHLDDITAAPVGILTYPEAGGERRNFSAAVIKTAAPTLAYKPIAEMDHPPGNIISANVSLRIRFSKIEFRA